MWAQIAAKPPTGKNALAPTPTPQPTQSTQPKEVKIKPILQAFKPEDPKQATPTVVLSKNAKRKLKKQAQETEKQIEIINVQPVSSGVEEYLKLSFSR